MAEFDLYKPMMNWLENYMVDKYRGYNIKVIDAHAERLDRVLERNNVNLSIAVGIEIQIDVLGIANKGDTNKIIFIEAKETAFVLRDLGQLWAYCKLIDPEEAFLLSSTGLGSLNKILNTYAREDLLDFGEGKKIKKMHVGKWDKQSEKPDYITLVPKL